MRFPSLSLLSSLLALFNIGVNAASHFRHQNNGPQTDSKVSEQLRTTVISADTNAAEFNVRTLERDNLRLVLHYSIKASKHTPAGKRERRQIEEAVAEALLPPTCAALGALVHSLNATSDRLAFAIAAEHVARALQHVLREAKRRERWTRALSSELHHMLHAVASLHSILQAGDSHEHEHHRHAHSAMEIRLGDDCRLQVGQNALQEVALELAIENALKALVAAAKRHMND